MTVSGWGTIWATSTVAGVVVGALALVEGLPADRVIVAGIIGWAVMFGLLVILRWRP